MWEDPWKPPPPTGGSTTLHPLPLPLPPTPEQRRTNRECQPGEGERNSPNCTDARKTLHWRIIVFSLSQVPSTQPAVSVKLCPLYGWALQPFPLLLVDSNQSTHVILVLLRAEPAPAVGHAAVKDGAHSQDDGPVLCGEVRQSAVKRAVKSTFTAAVKKCCHSSQLQ